MLVDFRDFSAFEAGAKNGESWKVGTLLIKLSLLLSEMMTRGLIDELRHAGRFTVQVDKQGLEFLHLDH